MEAPRAGGQHGDPRPLGANDGTNNGDTGGEHTGDLDEQL